MKLSILITYHNEKELLTQCLNSLKGQLDTCDEIILFDDASEAPPRKYIPSNLFVRVLKSDTCRGPAYARNQLLQAATGDYLHYHDADDLFHPDWARRIRRTLICSPCDVIFTEVASIRDSKPVSNEVIGLKKVAQGEDLIRFCIEHFMLVPAGTYKKELLKSIGGYRETLWQSEDFDFHVRLAAAKPKFEIILDPLITIRLRENSRSANRYETLRDAVTSIESLGNELSKEYFPILSEKAAVMGSQLFQLGHHKDARRAFRIAKKIGPPSYSHQNKTYQWLAQSWGQEIAERFAGIYRTFFPESFRRSMKDANS